MRVRVCVRVRACAWREGEGGMVLSTYLLRTLGGLVPLVWGQRVLIPASRCLVR